MRRWLCFAVVMAFAIPAIAHAQSVKEVSIAWRIATQSDHITDVQLEQGKLVEFATMVPVGAVVLNMAVLEDARILLPPGTVMAPSALPGKIFCEVKRRPRQEFFKCLEDTDADGAFDLYSSLFAREYFYDRTVSREFIVGSSRPWNRHPLTKPLPMSIFDKTDGAGLVFLQVGLVKNDRANSKLRFCLASTAGADDFCQEPVKIATATLPASINQFEAQVTLIARGENMARVSITPPSIGLVID